MGVGAVDAEFVSELDLVVLRLECAKIISRTGVRENHFAHWSLRKSFRAVESAKSRAVIGPFRAVESAKSRAVIGRRE